MPPSETSPLAPGALIAQRFEVRERLGEGGMGSVWRVLDRELDEEVALKALHGDVVVMEGALERFRREVKLARRITHPNVARTYDVGTAGELRFLTMELITGEPISRCIAEKRRPPVAEVLRIVEQVARGLSASHAVGVVHRDLKPDNVMVTGDRAVITDFGVARLVGAAEALAFATRASLVVGTPAYMAPEQLQGFELDGRADVYALGVVLFELLTGEYPFTSGIAARLWATPPDPCASAPDLPRALGDLVVRALAVDRAERPDAQWLAERIEALRGAPVAHGDLNLGAGYAPTGTLDPAPFYTPRAASVAVLPIVDDGDRAGMTLARGLTRALADALVSVRGLRVLPVSAATVSDGAAALETTRTLDADLAVGVSVQQAAQRVRARAQLFDVRRGVQTWAAHVDGAADDPFALEDALALVVASAIRARVGDGASRSGPTDPGPRALYDSARAAYDRWDLASVSEAIERLEEARAAHPDEPWIMSLLAAALVRRYQQVGGGDPGCVARAEELSLRALAVDPSVAGTYHTIGILRANAGELRASVRAFGEAIARAPLHAEAHGWIGSLLAETGHVDEGMRRLDVALRIDPRLAYVNVARARVFALTGDRARAEAALAEVEPIAGKSAVVSLNVRLAVWWGDRALAAAVADALAEAPAGAGWAVALPVMRAAAAGEFFPGAPDLFAELWSRAGASQRLRCMQIEIACEYLAAYGRIDEAFAWLERASTLPMVDLLWLDRCPALAALRGDARFGRVRAIMAARAASVWG